MKENIDNHSDENFDSSKDEDIEFDNVDGKDDSGAGDDGDDESISKTELDLDSFFGNRKKQSGGNDDKSLNKDSDDDESLIDTRDPNALIKKIQSQRDKLSNKAKSLEAQLQTSQGAKEFLNSFHSDPDFRMAVIRKYHPDLIKPVNVGEFVKTKLTEEFKDFKYDPSQKDDIGSDHWAYSVRSQELLKEAMEKKGGKSLKALEDIETEQADKSAKAKVKITADRKAAMKKFNWTVEDVKNFENNFLKKLSYLDVATTYVNLFDGVDISQSPAFKGGSKDSFRRKSKDVVTDDQLFGEGSALSF